jgi:hypothetical protein
VNIKNLVSEKKFFYNFSGKLKILVPTPHNTQVISLTKFFVCTLYNEVELNILVFDNKIVNDVQEINSLKKRKS